jgi:hypothetical protein
VANATPFFFHHPKLNSNDHAAIATRQVLHIINTYRKVAPDLKYEDIAVLSIAKNNGNAVFERLKKIPEFEHFVTKDEVSSAVQWEGTGTQWDDECRYMPFTWNKVPISPRALQGRGVYSRHVYIQSRCTPVKCM